MFAASAAHGKPDAYPEKTNWQRIIFKPAKCSQDPHGMTYIAIGKTVLAHPSYSTYGGQGRTTNIAPKPSDPLGCPGNPVQGGAFLLELKDSSFSLNPTFGTDVKLASDLGNDKYEASINGEPSFDKWKASVANGDSKVLEDDTIHGFTGFRSGMRCNDFASYQANDYFTPMGRNLTLSCSNLKDVWCKQNYVDCLVTYRFNDDIRIQYGFTVNDFPIAKVIEFDREARARLIAETVKNYPWVTTPTTSNDKEQPK